MAKGRIPDTDIQAIRERAAIEEIDGEAVWNFGVWESPIVFLAIPVAVFVVQCFVVSGLNVGAGRSTRTINRKL